ncbi:hypothetical protein IE81DRAFT_320928 [Ceraceosorus guamensis]|uniref:Uncharacterized protein n=1 Tax=Ceraceosorus guamensis TaxID=1522189 RepID=A0A316W561_9BASI|nr:hypothetical protein IE81DRAFT_320928 [Ceraceosorus guamensis]PWN44949.1 hypothetical protein IE81DRAFT_320928 [Ceraceosorus guamensis]
MPPASSTAGARRVPAGEPAATRTTRLRAKNATGSSAAAGGEVGSSKVAGKAPSKTDGAATGATNGAGANVLGTRKRSALGDVTNANAARAKAPSNVADGKQRATSSNTGLKETSTAAATTARSRSAMAPTTSTTAPARPARGASTAATGATRLAGSRAGSSRIAAPSGNATRKTTATDSRKGDSAAASNQDATARAAKRPRVDEVSAAAAKASAEAADAGLPITHAEDKDEGWEDLDAEDVDDPLMVAEYVNEIFVYMKQLEINCMPSPDYMDSQRDLTWKMRGVLVDWLIDVHKKFRLLPETLFLGLNIVDRFLSKRIINVSKLQLVGLTAMFVASKYEEVLCPSVSNWVYIAEGGYSEDEILRAEQYMLKILGFNLSYANPMNFLRRISKADNYDIQTRTVAKYFMEISLVDHRLIASPPSLVAAASAWLARKCLDRGDWTPTLVHYSSYSEAELLSTAEVMLDYCLRPVIHQSLFKKYGSSKFMKASVYVRNWAVDCFGVFYDEDDEMSEIDENDDLLVDLFEFQGYDPSEAVLQPSTSRKTTPLITHSRATSGATQSDAAGSVLNDSQKANGTTAAGAAHSPPQDVSGDFNRQKAEAADTDEMVADDSVDHLQQLTGQRAY